MACSTPSSRFAGSFVTADDAGAAFVGQATFRGCLALHEWPRAAVAALLPADLALPDASDAAASHPVAVAFGEQSEGGTIFAGLFAPLGVRYLEFALLVPWVRHRGGRGLCAWMARMYTGYFPAVWNGNLHYGFAKEQARMSWRDSLFVVASESGRLLLHAGVEPTGDWAPGPGAGPRGFAALEEAFRLPVLGRRQGGRWVRSYFDLDLHDGWIRPADSRLSVDAALLDGLEPGEHHDAADGSFQVRGMVWRLSWPLPLPS